MKNAKSIVTLLIVDIILVVLLGWYDTIFGPLLFGRAFSLFLIFLIGVFTLSNILLFVKLLQPVRWGVANLFTFFTFIIACVFLLIRVLFRPGFTLNTLGQGLILLLLVNLLVVVASIRRRPKKIKVRRNMPKKAPDVYEVKAQPKVEVITTSPQVKKTSSPKPSQKVLLIGSKTSDKVHEPSCISVKRIPKSHRITYTSKTDAARKGYLPCGMCKPF